MNGMNANIIRKAIKRHGFHNIRCHIAARKALEFSDMPAEIKKYLYYDGANQTMEKYVYVKVNKEQNDVALSALPDLEVITK